MAAFHSSVSCVRSWMARAARAAGTASSSLAGQRVVERPHRREPGRQPRVGRDRRLGALEQVKVLAAAGRVARQQQVGRQGQQPLGGVGQQRGSTVLRSSAAGSGRVVQEVGHDPVLQQGQRPVGLLRGEEVAGRAPGVTGRLEPFGRPQLELLLPGPVPGPQLGAQHLAHQMVVPEARPLVIERHQEQVGRVDAAQQRRRVLPAGDRRARARGQLAKDRRVQHELDHLRRLLLEDLGDEVLGDRVAADVQRPRHPRRVPGAAQRQRRHLQRRGPPLAALVQ